MKYLLQAHSLVDCAELHLLKEILEKMQIQCMVRNENLAGGVGEIPFLNCYPELWLLNERDQDRAQALIANWREAKRPPQAIWVCPQCTEIIDGQFGACWQCGTERD